PSLPRDSRLPCVYFFFLTSISFCSSFFFFQAEDGIRDRNVTGVQTCALPICDAVVLVVQRHRVSSASMGTRAVQPFICRFPKLPPVESHCTGRDFRAILGMCPVVASVPMGSASACSADSIRTGRYRVVIGGPPSRR